MRSTTVVFNLSIFAGILAGYLWLPPTVSAENSFSQTTLDSSKINTPKIQGVPDFTALMASEGNKVVHISAMQKSVPQALSPMELFKKLLPPEDNDEKNEPPPDLLKRKEKPQTGIGSGFFISSEGYLLTNAHVVGMPDLGDDEKLVMALSGAGRVTARPITKESIDLDHDLAVLRFDGPPMPALRLGDSSSVRDGQDVAVTGFPLGGSIGIVPVTHKGIVSAITPIGQPVSTAKQLDGAAVRRLAAGGYSVIQLDLISYPGNSGSPMFDATSGEVLGVLSMVFIKGGKESAVTSPSGISYAIPAAFVKTLLAP